MKIKDLIAMAGNCRHMDLLNTRVGGEIVRQHLSLNGTAIFPLDGLQTISEETLLALADVGEDSIGNLAASYLKNMPHLTPEEAKETLQSMIRSKVYQKNYQKALKTQVDGIMDTMQEKQFSTVSDYLSQCYENGFIGTMYDLQGQGIPMCIPIDQSAMVRAVQLDSKISQGLYARLGEDVAMLKKKITAQVSRGISSGMSYKQVAQQLAGQTKIGFNNAVRIARTEGHRIQAQSTMDAAYKAQEKGADMLKQWDAALDSRTRESHTIVDGEIRELDKPFSNGLMFPGDPAGGAAEVVNCRCALLQRARWALDEEELEELKRRAEYFGLDKTEQFEDFKQNYIEKSNYVPLDETIKVKPNSGGSNEYSVDAQFVNSKKYHDKFESLTESKNVDEAIYQESMRMLAHRNGTDGEDMVLLDARTGKFVVGNMESKLSGRTGLTKEQFAKAAAHKGDLIIVHNHPNSSRISYKDILSMYENPNISAIVMVGHDGSLQKVSHLDRKFPIDKLWESVYNDSVLELGDKVLAEHKATTALYEAGKKRKIFKTESR
jgi:hypothetical protein